MPLPVKLARADDNENRRWQAAITYIDKSWQFFNFDEFDELGKFIEAGPNWNLIEDISITPNSREPIGEFTDREVP